MKKICILLIIHILCAYPITAQITDSLASDIARKIWKSLERTDPCPTVFFGDDEAMATYSYEDHRIRLSKMRVQEAFETKFRSAAPAALAIVIGHEIYHALRGDKQLQRFGYWGADNVSKEEELNADLHGLLWAYFIGYLQAIDVFDRIFPTGSAGGYPGKQERMESDDALKKKAAKYFQIFELGNLLLTAADKNEDYEYARQCYQYIQGEIAIATQELEYSLGLSWFLQALSLRSAEPLVFPLEFSGFSALKRLGGAKFSSEDVNDKLNKAVYHFSRSIAAANTLDGKQSADYLLAHIGLCSAQMLKNIDFEEAKIDALEREFPQKAEIKLLRAVFWALRNKEKDLEHSKTLLKVLADAPDAMHHVQAMARFNLTILDPNVAPAFVPTSQQCPDLSNPSTGLSALLDSLGNRTNGIHLSVAGNVLVNIKSLKSGTVYIIEKWLGRSGVNHTQRIFQKSHRCNCAPATNSVPGLNFQGQYLFWRHLDAKTGIILPLDGSPDKAQHCFRVFRP